MWRTSDNDTVDAFHKWLEENADIVDACKAGEEWTLWNAYGDGVTRGRRELQLELIELLGLPVARRKR